MIVLNLYLCLCIDMALSTIAKYMNKFPNKYCNKLTTVTNIYLRVY